MSCTTSNSPIDINKKGVSGLCDLKCDYKFNYHKSTCSVKNRGQYLSITYDNKSASSAPVIYNTQPYNVSEIRVYTPSLHTYNGNKASGEIIIIHDPLNGGKQLLVCVPVKSSSGYSDGNHFISKIIKSVANNAQNEGDSMIINIDDDFTLNDFVPTSSFYTYNGVAPYSPCTDKVTIIVFDLPDSKINTSDSSMKFLSQILFTHNYTTKNGTSYYFNKKGSISTLSSDGEIYIDCRPVGHSSEQVEVTKSKGDTTTTPSKKIDLWEMPETQIVLGVVSFGGLILLASQLFKKSNVQK
tara:strand:- start:485 stop:1378 length:894 start_codon:yes stop_codon:yes gene_type:complete